jgi:anaerobic selenocysteine-containing dehydrogenase
MGTQIESARKIIHGACPHDCPDTCAILTAVENGRAISLRGDPEHPFTRGALCVKVEDYLDRVYSPERVLYPMRRTGPKGSGTFERISWDSALDEIAARLKRIITEDGAEAVLPCSYLGNEGLINGLNVGDAFFNRLGATVSERTFCASGLVTGWLMTIGPTPGMDPESLLYSKYIVIWACNVISTNFHLWPIIAEAQRRGARVVVIDPLRNRTAVEADWHIPIRPGTDCALALGLINVIIRENLVDRDYVASYTIGFPELERRASEYSPERVSSITAIPAADIVRLAREYSKSQPAAIRIGVAIERSSSGGQAVRAICSLPALVGAWRHVGGGLVGMPHFAFPIKWDLVSRPDFIRSGTRHCNQYSLGAALTGKLGFKPPIKALFVYNCNPVVTVPDQQRVITGLSREDLFTVVSEQFMTDTADFADILLPATTQLEQFDVMWSWGHLYISVNNPAIAPLGEAIPNVELFRRLAARMGFDEQCFRRDDEQIAREAIDWSSPVLEGINLDDLKRNGHARLKLGSPDSFAPHARGNFPTESGKTELVSSLASGGNFVVPVFRQGSTASQASEPVDPLPSYEAALESPHAARYPLNLISPKSHAFLNSSCGNMTRQRRIAGEPTVMIHPDDTARRGIVDAQPVQVFNDRGSFSAVARVTTNVCSGVIVAPMGYWRKFSPSRSTVNVCNPTAFADLGHAPTFSNNMVEMRRLSTPGED